MTNISKEKKSRGRDPNGDPNPVDIHVGQRIRQRRTLLGLSQENVAKLLGLTFQQIQKYEHGTNRIGASRLWDMKNILGLETTDYFYSDMPKEVRDQSPRMFFLDDNLPKGEEETEYTQNFQDPMARKDVVQIANGYIKLTKRNPNIAEKIFGLIDAMSKTTITERDDDEENE